MKKLGVFALLFCTFVVGLRAQQLSYPIDTINGNVYYRYVVEKGVGLYRVSKIFNTSQELILQTNPSIQQAGLVYGDTILIPLHVKEEVVAKTEIKERLSRRSRMVKQDTTVKVDTVLEMDSSSVVADVHHLDTTRLAIMLPLYASAEKRTSTMDRFLDFYLGVLLAVREQQQDGHFIELYTYDIEKSTQQIDSITSDSVWRDVDAIIGPVYSAQVDKMLEFTQRDSTYMLVPFISEINVEHSNPNVLLFKPSVQDEANALVQYLATNVDSINCVVVEPKLGENIPMSIQYIHAALCDYNISTTSTTIRDILSDSLTNALVEGKNNIVIFNTEKYSNVQAMMPHLDSLKNDYSITLLSRYAWQGETIELPQLYTSMFNESVEIPESYQQAYEYYFKDEIIAQYPRYDLLGYDLTKNLLNCLQNGDTSALQALWKGIQSEIEYETSPSQNGYVNKRVNVIRK
jgi:hypothetical protein